MFSETFIGLCIIHGMGMLCVNVDSGEGWMKYFRKERNLDYGGGGEII